MSLKLLIFIISAFLSLISAATILFLLIKKSKSYSEALYYINCSLLGFLPLLFLLRLLSAVMAVKGVDVPNLLRYTELIISPFYGVMLFLHITLNRQYFLMPAAFLIKRTVKQMSEFFDTELKQEKLINETNKS
jgi:hypothetical protein